MAGSVSMPWDRTDPHPMLRQWAERTDLAGAGRRAVVVGCGLGADAAYLASLGFTTVGFDSVPEDKGPPFALTRETMASLAVDGLLVSTLEELPGPLWRVEYHRPLEAPRP